MDIYEAVQKRYSVRAYRDRAVEEDKLDRVLNAGRLAPSARNCQDWKFVAVRDGATRRKLAEASEQPWLAKAPVIVAVVSTNPERVMHCRVPAAPVDCAIAADHMTLAAVAEGLGSCWIGHFDQDLCCEILDVPPTAKIIVLLAMGYPASDQPPRTRKPLDEVVCHDAFA